MKPPSESSDRLDRIHGCLLGLAVGDALGLPREGLSPQRAARLFGTGPLEQRLITGYGLCSDDTEHACMTAQALLASRGDKYRFSRSLAWRLRGWIVALPPGVGLATLRAITKLWLGFPPHLSGVHSAGNGPAMRAPLLGVVARMDLEELEGWVRASTVLTHRDPLAEDGAHLVARAAHLAAWREGDLDPMQVITRLQSEATTVRFQEALELVRHHLQEASEPGRFAKDLQCEGGVTGFILHTVPAALFCWLRYPKDFRAAVEAVIRLGGDSDTTAAIVGGLAGATLGPSAIPASWSEHLIEWPRNKAHLLELSNRLSRQFPAQVEGALQRPVPLPWPLLLPRNFLFLGIVLGHGLRRLFPPY
jgi:ADP-ribosylglycohydrolase